MTDCSFGFVDIKNRAGFVDKRAVKAALQQARIVFTTCAGSGSQQVALQRYALLVVDEASQVGAGMLLLRICMPLLHIIVAHVHAIITCAC